MLEIVIPEQECFDETTETFFNLPKVTLRMEHSLISISKWEAKWHRAFLTKRERTTEQTLDYFRCMTINTVDPRVFDRLTADNVTDIVNYINEPMTAVYMGEGGDKGPGGPKDTTTSELIYYYMTALNIPFECEKWHLNKLLALIHVCEVKNTPPKKMKQSDIARRNAKLNAARRKQHHTRG